jgi:hypothetical protein
MPVAPSLAELQSQISASLYAPADAAAQSYVCAAGIAPAARLQIYRNNIHHTLMQALRITFPAVRGLVGEAFFDAAALAYIERHPATDPWLETYGGEFGEFLAAFAPAASLPYLPDVAQLEALLNQARYADDAAAIDLTALQRVDETRAADLRFRIHPAVSLMWAGTPVDAIVDAVLHGTDEDLAALDLDAGPVRLLIHRGLQGVGVRRLDADGWRFFSALMSGAPLGEAASHAATVVPELLLDHLQHQDLAGFTLVGEER